MLKNTTFDFNSVLIIMLS